MPWGTTAKSGPAPRSGTRSATAEESGLSSATLASMRLRPIKIASIASGMPWPRIFSEP